MQAEKTFTPNSALKILTVFLVLTFILSASLHAEIINVPDDFETIQAAIDEAENGDTVLVAPGEYEENIDFLGKAIVVIGNPENPDDTIIDGDGAGTVVMFDNDENSSSVLQGFTIRNGLAENWGGGVVCNRSHPRLMDLIICDNQARYGGGFFGNGCRGEGEPLMTRVVIRDNRAENSAGMALAALIDVVIEEISVTGNMATRGGIGGIFTDGCDALTVERACIAANRYEGEGVTAWYAEDPVEITLNNVTITDHETENHSSVAFSSMGARGTITITNSIIHNNSDTEIRLGIEEDGSVTLNASYSDINGGEDNIQVDFNCNLNWGEGNIDEDPLFVDPDEGDYHLTEDSPCIDAGDPESPEDPDGTRADMGAYYFHQNHIIDVPEDFETIQEAINAAEDGDTVLVHPGEYVENIDFIGKDIVVGSLYLTTSDTAYIDSTVIDGDSSGSVVRFDNGEGEDAVLTGFTIRNGSGGIYVKDGCPTIRNCTIADNSADLGGGIYCAMYGGIPVYGPRIIDCIIRDNTAVHGGGIYCNGRFDVNIRNCTINGNSAENNGGGVYIYWYSSVILEDCVINGNNSGEAGGGIYGGFSELEMTGLELAYNESGFQAGAIYCRQSSSTLARSLLLANTTGERCGGIVLDDLSTMNVVNVTFTLNWAEMVRCGIHLRASSQATVVNSIFWRNWPAQICFGEGDRSLVTISHCDVEEGEDGIIGDGDVNWLDGNIDEDPQFVNTDEDDLNLAAGSPCIDAGIAFFVWEQDTIVNLTPDDYIGNAPDMGAFESEFTDVDDSHVDLPDEFRLYPAYPNPFNASTKLRFDLPREGDVYLAVYDLMGRKVTELLKGRLQAGRYSLTWQAADLPSGLYIVEFALGENVLHQKAILVK